jgi:tight adherence protein C
MWGAALGAACGCGLVIVAARVSALRRPPLETRVQPYIRDLERPGRDRENGVHGAGPFTAVFGEPLGALADVLGRTLGGSASIARRLERADLAMSVRDFRVEQVLWGTVGFGCAAALSAAVAARAPNRTLPLLLLCLVAFGVAALLRENRLTAQVAARERRILAEFPTVAELMALSVSAGEGPVAALDRVVSRCHGELPSDLARVLAEVHTGTPVTAALDAMAGRSGLPVVARFAEGMSVAIDRGTPLAGVLQAQAVDVREAGRRRLIETGARKEVLMMVPVVFLILPVTVLFAFWPGVVGLHLVTP